MSKNRRAKRDKDSSQAQAAQQAQMLNALLRGAILNPSTLSQGASGARPMPTGLAGFPALRAMSERCAPVSAIVLTRQDQVARFCRRPSTKGGVGFRVRLKDVDAKPTAADRKMIQQLEDWILACGRGPSMTTYVRRDGFEHYIRKAARDSLVLDAVATEKRFDRMGVLYDWWALDGASVRFTVPKAEPNINMGAGALAEPGTGYGGVGFEPSEEEPQASYIQFHQGMPIAEFGQDDLAYWIRNPRTDMEANGYGLSELEVLIGVVTDILNGMSYNGRFFTQGSIPEGILALTGRYTEEAMDDFRRNWNAMVAGLDNSWRIPILHSPDKNAAQWINTKGSNREMMFQEWLDFLLTMACAVYRIDREELGFGAKGAGEPGGLGGSADNSATLRHSASKGLWPLMSRLESGINEDILAHLPDSEDFCFTWAGLDPDDEAQREDLDTKALAAGGITPNEYRARRDMKPIPDELMWGDAPASATLMQAFMLGAQAKLQAQGGGDEAPDDEAGAPDGAPDDQDDPMKLPIVNEDGSEEEDQDA